MSVKIRRVLGNGVYVCGGVRVCVCVQVLMGMCATSGIVLQPLSTFFGTWAQWVGGQQAPGTLPPGSSALGLLAYATILLFLCECWGSNSGL